MVASKGEVMKVSEMALIGLVYVAMLAYVVLTNL
jgi:hypothetical protein